VATAGASVAGAELGVAAGAQAANKVAKATIMLMNIRVKRLVFISLYLHF
jgi:hypothetical protein